MNVRRIGALTAAVALVLGGAASASSGIEKPRWKIKEDTGAMTTWAKPGSGFEIKTSSGGKPKVVKGKKTMGVSVAVPRNVSSRTRGVSAVSTEPTVYEMGLESGMSPEESCEFAQGMDPYGCKTSQEVAGEGLSSSRQGAQRSADFLGSECVNIKATKGDGTKRAHACVSFYHDAYVGNSRYIAARSKVTGWNDDPGWFRDRITGVAVQARFSASDSYAVDWDPETTREVGKCRKSSTTATSPKSGAQYSVSTEVCPDKLSPFHSPEFQYFGAKWTGDPAPAGDRRGAVATSVHKIPKKQGYGRWPYAWIRWN